MPTDGNVRARAIARLKVLTAVGAGVAVSCGKSKGLADGHKPGDPEPYGVVDPMPRPTCFEGPQPTITAAYMAVPDAGAKKKADAGAMLALTPDTRLVEVAVAFTQTDIALGNVTSTDPNVSIVESKPEASGIKLIVRVPKTEGGSADRPISVSTSCARGLTTIQITLRTTATAVEPQVYAY